MILLIDTALETASVGIMKEDGALIAERTNNRQSDHAAWLHPAMQELMQETGITISQLQAVGVTAGPGSYTGLRVGMAAAKGICYAQNIPLIAASTLQVIAAGVRDEKGDVILALIDARRDEVYAGIFDKEIQPLQPEQAIRLEPDTFLQWRRKHQIIYSGNGAAKALNCFNIKDLTLPPTKNGLLNLSWVVSKKWLARDFADLAYHEPTYLKEFYSTPKDK